MIALNTDFQIWPTSPLIFCAGGVLKVQNLTFEVLWFQTYHLSFSRLKRFYDGMGINRFSQLGETGDTNFYKFAPNLLSRGLARRQVAFKLQCFRN